MQRKQGFTLIELLVVIAIIAILAAILFPVFAQVREKARAISCLSNMKQIGLAVVQYNQDYDEKMPNGMDGYGRGTGWAWQAYPYVKSVKAYQCPDDANVGTVASSYALNSNLGIASTLPGNPYGTSDGRTAAQFNAPTKTVMLFEIANSSGYDISNATGVYANGNNSDTMYGGGSPAGYGYGSDYDPNGYNGQAATGATPSDGKLKYATGWLRYSSQDGQFLSQKGRHQSGSNFLMADTHAKYMQPSAVTAGYDDPSDGYCGGIYSPGPTGGATAANTNCTDATIAATFSVH